MLLHQTGLLAPGVFDDLQDESVFVSLMRLCYRRIALEFGCRVTLNETRLLEAHQFWAQDMERLRRFELPTSASIDQFKQVGHLVYWLRRSSPIVACECVEPVEGEDEGPRAFFLKYDSQYCALVLGFELCAFHCANAVGSDFYASDYQLDRDFAEVMCHFLKVKSVSPHALHLIFKSLFADPLFAVRSAQL
jgi:hypothetical protein